MRAEKLFRLGRVNIEGDLIDFHPESPLSFEADRQDALSVGVAYSYREMSEDREETRIRLTAQIDGGKPETFEAIIGDSPLVDDSRRGFLSIPVRVVKSGVARGTFRLEVSYASGPWRAAVPLTPDAQTRAEGEFVVNVR